MKILVDLFENRRPRKRIPVWFMRQAGRYLPEYRDLRQKFPSFLDFCLSPQAAAEATLQPLRRFDLDAAILFSDILVVPYGLGQQVEFKMGEGPILEPVMDEKDLKKLSLENLKEVKSLTAQAIQEVKSHLALGKTLIGFAGAPWTVMCYMIQGQGSKDFAKVRTHVARYPSFFKALRDILTEATLVHLKAQIDAGADVIKLFDSWAGLCPSWLIQEALIEPVSFLRAALKKDFPHTPFLYFPKGVGEKAADLAKRVGADGLALDPFIDPTWLLTQDLGDLVLQGGLDPAVLVAGGDRLKTEVFRYLDLFKGRPYIFNLGHGMTPDVPFSHVQDMIGYVRSWEGL